MVGSQNGGSWYAVLEMKCSRVAPSASFAPVLPALSFSLTFACDAIRCAEARLRCPRPRQGNEITEEPPFITRRMTVRTATLPWVTSDFARQKYTHSLPSSPLLISLPPPCTSPDIQHPAPGATELGMPWQKARARTRAQAQTRTQAWTQAQHAGADAGVDTNAASNAGNEERGVTRRLP